MLSGRQVEKIETHISGFDEITGGGLPKSSALLFIGETDGCKELLVKQICWSVLIAGGRVLYCTVDQSVEDVRQSMATRGWAVENHEKAGKFRFIDVYSIVSASRTGSDSGNSLLKDGFLAQTAMNMFFNEGVRFFPHGSVLPKVAVLDSLSRLLSVNGVETPQLLSLLKDGTRVAGVTGIGIMDSDTVAEQTVKSYADGIIRLTMMRDDHSKGVIEVIKYAGQYGNGRYPFKASEKGFEVLV